MTTTVHNVEDRRNQWVGSWAIEMLDYAALKPTDIGRTVIYHGHKRYEAGTLNSWRDGVVFVIFDTGCTAAGCRPESLSFGIEQIGYRRD